MSVTAVKWDERAARGAPCAQLCGHIDAVVNGSPARNAGKRNNGDDAATVAVR